MRFTVIFTIYFDSIIRYFGNFKVELRIRLLVAVEELAINKKNFETLSFFPFLLFNWVAVPKRSF
jgi:hypothetical protein